MALGVVRRRKLNILLVILAATISIVAAIVVLYVKGAFLPSWIMWNDISMDTSFLRKGVKVQDILHGDIDCDGQDELLVLCWRIGRYGDRRPFWVTHDELKWSQHIYIYEETDNNQVKAKWMASDIHTDVARWEMLENRLLATYTPGGKQNVWVWNSWGLERLPEEKIEKYLANKADEEVENELGGNEGVEGIEEKTVSDNQLEIDVASEEPWQISIVMVGDILLHDGVTMSCRQDDGTYDFSFLFNNTEDVIRNADIAIVNQEVIIGGEELGISGYPAFNAPYEIGDALYDAGFDVVCHATNHALDRGKKGIINCLNYWRNNHPDMAVLGIHDSIENSENMYIREVNDFKIAILNYTYGTNGIPMPEGMPYAVEMLDKKKIAEDLAYAEENADFTIVCPHWGIEYQLKENAEQEKMAEFLSDNGADLIIGTHPHVLEPVKWIETENGNRTLCYYSLGNYINWTSGRGASVANRMVGGMAAVTIMPDYSADSADNHNELIVDSDMISDFAVYPVVSHVEHEKGSVTTYFLGDYTEEYALKNAIKEQDSSFDMEYCNNLCSTVLGDVAQYVVPGR